MWHRHPRRWSWRPRTATGDAGCAHAFMENPNCTATGVRQTPCRYLHRRRILFAKERRWRAQMRSRFSFPAVSGLFLLAATFASAQDIFVTPVPNAPFTGVIKVERSVVLRDGSVKDFRTIREIGRDSRGRIFSTGTVNRPPETQPPALLDGSTTGNSIPRNDFTKQEDLGNRQMEGLAVHGVRETQTIPAENSPAGKEIVVTDEFWYSADLRINMLIKHSDPRTGSVTMTVTQVKRSEPDPALLEIPEGYKPFGARAETGAKQERNQ